MCAIRAPLIADAAAAAVARAPLMTLAEGWIPATVFASTSAPGSPGPATTTTPPEARRVRRCAAYHRAADGVTLMARPAHDGSTDQGRDCSQPAGMTTKERSPM